MRNLTFDRTRSPVFKKSLYFIPGKFRINRDRLLINRLILLDMDFELGPDQNVKLNRKLKHFCFYIRGQVTDK